jgi:hypothetical protein
MMATVHTTHAPLLRVLRHKMRNTNDPTPGVSPAYPSPSYEVVCMNVAYIPSTTGHNERPKQHLCLYSNHDRCKAAMAAKP